MTLNDTMRELDRRDKRDKRDERRRGNGEDSGDSDIEFGDRTEIALTEALVTMYPDVRYVSHWHRWYLWDGRVWSKDTTTAMYDRIRGICREAAKGTNSESVCRVLKKSQTIAGIERIARSDRQYAATVDQWDQDPWLLNTPGGVVDLKTGRVKPHSPGYHMTKMTAAGPGDDCSQWIAFLNTVMGDDQDLIGYLRRYFGYCLTGVTSEHVFQFDFGTGRNGKGVFHNTLRGVMGTYAMSTGMETFTEAYGDRHPTELASLVGARLVTAEEVEEGRRWAENRIKQMSGGTPISARFMRQDFFEYTPSFKLMIAGNHKPGLRDVDQAIRDRIQIVPFKVYIEPEKRDKGLEDKLREEWPGILRWGIEGCLEWRERGLAVPEAVRAETESYFDTQDVFGSWLDECCVTDQKSWEPPSRLFAGWREYAKDNNTKTGTQSEFTDRLMSRGFHRTDDRKARRWQGIKLVNDPGISRP